MKLIIEVPDAKADKVKEFLAAIEKPVTPNKGIPGVTILVRKCAPPIELSVRGIHITAQDWPELTFKVGDVVENTKSGNWGVIKTVRSNGWLVVTCSKETRKESGQKTMDFDPRETSHLV